MTAVSEVTAETETRAGAAVVRLVDKALVTLVGAAVVALALVAATTGAAAALDVVVVVVAAVGASEGTVDEVETAVSEGGGGGGGRVTELNEEAMDAGAAVVVVVMLVALLAEGARLHNGTVVEGTAGSDDETAVVGGEIARAPVAEVMVVLVVVVAVAVVESAVATCDGGIDGPAEAALPSGDCIGLWTDRTSPKLASFALEPCPIFRLHQMYDTTTELQF